MSAGTIFALALVGASTSGGHGAQGPSVALGTLLATWIAFGILFGVLTKFAWGPLLALVEEREKKLSGDLARAEAARTAAEKSLAQYRSKIESAHRETERILADGRTKAEAVSDRIVEDARKEAEGTVEKARKAIEEERRKAVADLQGRLGKISVLLAGKILEKEIRPENHADLIARFTKELGATSKAASH